MIWKAYNGCIYHLQVVSRCPACMSNFLQLLCQMTCSPNQSDFMVATEVEDVPTNSSLQYISKLAYVVHTEFGDGMLQSCRDVQNPSSGQKALDMLCGESAEKCTPKDWLNFMGDKNKNPMAPFQIDYTLTNQSTTIEGKLLYPMDAVIDPCNKSCSCQDCRSACAPVVPDKPQTPWTIGGYDAMYVIMSAILAGFIILFGSTQIFTLLYCPARLTNTEFRLKRKVNRESNSDEECILDDAAVSSLGERLSCCNKLQAKFDAVLTSVFAAWGGVCARRPVIVIGISVVVCFVMMIGISKFQVVTDPVELWSAPDSRARLEKNYFDDNFGYVALSKFC